MEFKNYVTDLCSILVPLSSKVTKIRELSKQNKEKQSLGHHVKVSKSGKKFSIEERIIYFLLQIISSSTHTSLHNIEANIIKGKADT